MIHWTQHCSSNYSDLLLRPKVADVDPFGQQINQACNKETKHGILEVYAGKKCTSTFENVEREQI